MHEVLVNRLGGLSLPRESVVRLTDRPDMTLDVYRGRLATIHQQQSSTTEIPGFIELFEGVQWRKLQSESANGMSVLPISEISVLPI